MNVKPCIKCGACDRNQSGKCRACKKANNAAYRAAYPAKIKARTDAYHAAHPGRAKAIASAYYTANKERVKASQAEWKAANPEVRRIQDHNRRARKLSAGGTLAKGLPAKLLKLQKGRCPCCSQPLGDKPHLDHIMPLSLGGSNTDDNMQLLRATCNLQKHAKHPIDFMQSKGHLL